MSNSTRTGGGTDTAHQPSTSGNQAGVHRYDGPSAEHEPATRTTAAASTSASTSVSGVGAHGPWGPGPVRATERPRPSRPSLPMVALLLVAALVVGGASGFVGAAGFASVDNSFGPPNTVGSGSQSTAPQAPAGSAGGAGLSSAEQVAQLVLPSVVKINVQSAQGAGSGSGIVLSADGEILTNNHVASVAGSSGTMTVNFNDGTTKRARLVGADPLTDLAVIKVQNVSGLTPATIDRSNDLQVGESVLALGSPFGLQATVTSGIVSALNRPVSVGSAAGGGDTTYPAIQTDAPINPGNSGGPLVNLKGQVVGIDSSIRTASDATTGAQAGSIGLGFAIPIAQVLPIIDQLRAGQTPTHAQLGISVADASSNNGLLTGAGVQAVASGSAAAQAGLQRGEVITKVDGEVITGAESLVATIRGHRPGDTVQLTVVDGGTKAHTLRVVLESDHGSPSS